MSLLVAVLVASLSGSLHCAGMCGPLVAFAVGASGERSWPVRSALQAAYHGGRLLTYALVGGLAGGIGAAINVGGTQLGFARVATLLAGGMMIAVGSAMLLRYFGVPLGAWPLPEVIRKGIVRGQRMAMGLQPLPRALTMGLLTAFLPCGWLYLFLLAATGTGSLWRGGALMAAFWFGTLPVLVSLGIGVQALSAAFARRVPLIAGIVVIALGVSTITTRWSVRWDAAAMAIPGEASARSPGSLPATTAEQIQALGDTTPPCCRHHDE